MICSMKKPQGAGGHVSVPVRERVRHRQQLAAAVAYERDPERRRIVADLQRASLQKID
jgi:hypothetical protein